MVSAGADSRSEMARHVAGWIGGAIRAAPVGHTPLLFLSGAQGSGKSTALAGALDALPHAVAGASLDDFYLPAAERAGLAARISPLFKVRGPPGTHDLALLARTIAALRAAGPETETRLPAFDKLADDRAPPERWRTFRGRPAAIVIEGWMMGARPDPAAPDAPPINDVETSDRNGAWRRAQEAALAGPYADLWDMADGFLHILAQDFDCVAAWRLEQETALWAADGKALPPERRDWVAQFVRHYERLTRRMISGGRRPGAEIHIGADRRILGTVRL